jgi:hypothetical protein
MEIACGTLPAVCRTEDKIDICTPIYRTQWTWYYPKILWGRGFAQLLIRRLCVRVAPGVLKLKDLVKPPGLCCLLFLRGYFHSFV